MKRYAILPYIFQNTLYFPTRLVLKHKYNLQITGQEHLCSSPFILASNHIGELDPFLLASALPAPLKNLPLFFTTLEKHWYKRNRFGWRQHIYGGQIFRMWGGYEVSIGKRDYAQSLQSHIIILNHGYNVCIFPEGKMNPRQLTLEAKGGVAFLAHRTHTRVIPVSIRKSEHSPSIHIHIRPPLSPEHLFGHIQNSNSSFHPSYYKHIAQYIMKHIYTRNT